MVIKALDDEQRTAIACGQTRTFGGLAGVLPGEPAANLRGVDAARRVVGPVRRHG